MSRWYWLWCLVLALAWSSPLVAEKESGDESTLDPPVWLREGSLQTGQIDLDKAILACDFRLQVTSDMYAIRVFLQDAEADVDLEILDAHDNVVWSAQTRDFNERIKAWRLGDPPLENGIYIMRVAWLQDFRPSSQGKPLSSVGFNIGLSAMRIGQPQVLPLATLREDKLEQDSGMFRMYQVLVPADTREIRIDAVGITADIDIFVQAYRPFTDPRDAELASQSYRAREQLIIPLTNPEKPKVAGAKPISSSRTNIPVYVMITSEPDDVAAPFSVMVSSGSSAPAVLQRAPELNFRPKQAATPQLERAMQATVEIIGSNGGGSACLISPDGWLLTNYHVVRGDDGQPEERLSVGFSTDCRLPPDSQFWAKVEAWDKDRDLALLHIVSGFYDQHLPAGYQFPYLDLGTPASLRIGDALLFVGYPSIGGLGNRATITCTQGILSGFQDRGFGLLLKTAAEISAGNSGGAALDSQGRLIGLPTIVVGDDSSQLAYISSVDLIPVAWRKRLA